MVARLTKISNTLGRYFHIARVGSSVSGITSLYIRHPRLCSSAARLNLVVAYILCSIHYFLESLHFSTHDIDTETAVSILISSNLCDDTSSYRTQH